MMALVLALLPAAAQVMVSVQRWVMQMLSAVVSVEISVLMCCLTAMMQSVVCAASEEVENRLRCTESVSGECRMSGVMLRGLCSVWRG